MSASESPLYPAALALSLAASLRVRARPEFLVDLAAALTRSMYSTRLESANLVIALAGVSSCLFALSWGRCPYFAAFLRGSVNQDMKLDKVTR